MAAQPTSLAEAVAALSAPLPHGVTVHYAKHMAHHLDLTADAVVDRRVPQRAADPRPGRGGRVVRPLPRGLRARRHRAAAGAVAPDALGRGRPRRPGDRRRRLPPRPRGAPALALRLARHRLHRPDALLAARSARLGRRVGAVLVRRRAGLDRLRAVPAARGRAVARTTRRSPRPAGRRTRRCGERRFLPQ